MASESDPKRNDETKVLLIAQLCAHLVSGESFDLLPIKHETNVKNEVRSLIQSWSESGFLMQGRVIYPWHEIKRIDVRQVEEMPLQLAQRRYDELYGAQHVRADEDFWHARHENNQQ